MFIKQRQVRRSAKFTSKFASSSRRRREYATSIYVTALVQLILSVFLVVSAARGFLAMREKFPDMAWYVTYGVPIGVLLIAGLVLKSSIGNFRYGFDIHREQRAGGADDRHGPPDSLS